MLQIRREEHTTPSLHGSDGLSPLSALFLELVQSERCFTNTKTNTSSGYWTYLSLLQSFDSLCNSDSLSFSLHRCSDRWGVSLLSE